MGKRCFSIHFSFIKVVILNTLFLSIPSPLSSQLLHCPHLEWPSRSLHFSHACIHESCPKSCRHPQLFHLCNHKFRHVYQLPIFSTFLLKLLLINLILNIPETPVLNSFLSLSFTLIYIQLKFSQSITCLFSQFPHLIILLSPLPGKCLPLY